MLRRVGAKGLSMVAHRLALPLIVVATVFLVVIPLVDERTIYISESNLKPRASTALRDDDFPTAYEGQATSSILGGGEGGIASTTVRAERSPGGLVTCVLVNLDAQLSMMIAAALYRAFERERAGILTGDLRFLFFSWHAPSGSNQSFDVVADSIPASEVDVVFVLDVYQVTTTEAPQVISGNKNSPLLNLIASGPQSVCINVMGSNSIQPNLDIVNLAVMFGNQMKLKFDVSCQAPSSVSSGLPAQSDFADLIVTVIPTVDDKTAMRWGQYMRTLATVATVGATPQYGGRRIRARGMHGLVLHSPEPVLALPNSSSTSRAKELMPLAATLEGTIRAVNNLDERLHHSFPVYVHTSSEKFVDFEVLQFVVFIVLGAIGSSLYASYRRRAELRPSCDIEWLLLVGPDVAREVVFMLLTLSAIAWDELDSTTSTPSPTALVLVLTSRWLWTLASKKKVRPVPGVDYQKFAKDERMCQVEASSLVMGLWASVTVCLLLAYNPLLSLPGSVLMGWQSVVSAYSVRIMQDSRRALIAKASCALWLLFQTTITCFVAQWIIQHRTDKDGANTQFALYGLGTSVVWLVQQCIVALWS